MAACLAAAPGGRRRQAAQPAATPTPTPSGRLLANDVFVSAFAVQALSALAQYALLLLTPLILDARGWSAGRIGLVLSTLTVGMIAVGPSGGRVGDRIGRRAPVVAGLAVAAAATAVAAVAGPGIAPAVLVAVLASFGLGLGFATPGATTAGLESVAEHRTGSAGGVLSTARYVGSIITTIAISALVASDAAGSEVVLVLATSATVAACLLALRLPGRPTSPAPLVAPRPASGRAG
jgi:DHA2 family methylenomycin A resistance protein-like MFS transporter